MTGVSHRNPVEALLDDYVADPDATWSLGGYGALAAFVRGRAEPARPVGDGRIGCVTERGALALTAVPDLRPFAFETGFTGGWSQAVALCLPAEACAMGRRAVLTELGQDRGAARPEDRGAVLFDLGLGLRAVDACVRVAEPALADRLRAAAGHPVREPGHPLNALLRALSPHRVFVARIGRIEVYTPIAVEARVGPPEPRTHVLPKLLARGRTHAATAPIPRGLIPCGFLHPPHPGLDESGRAAPLDRARHAAFGRILDAWGDPVLVALRRAVLSGLAPDPGPADGRAARSAIRAARAQVRSRDHGVGPDRTASG
jgi:hypothetical protein